MQRLMIIFFVFFMLLGCVRKATIEQGNVLTPTMVSKLHVGMSENEVKNIMGTPLLLNTFADDRVDYVYTLKPGYKKRDEKYVTLIFQHGKLKQITGNLYSQVIK